MMTSRLVLLLALVYQVKSWPGNKNNQDLVDSLSVRQQHGIIIKNNFGVNNELMNQRKEKKRVNGAVATHNRPMFSYIGCFADKRELRDIGDKDFTFITKYNKTMPTVELCVYLCSQDGYNFAGVQAFDECYCGNSYGRYNETDSHNCFFQCGGKYTCGGYNANSVYYINRPSLEMSPASEYDRSLSMNNNLLSTTLNPCQTSPCQNSGICVTLMDDKGTPRGFLCKCIAPQDSGTYCEERNYCYSNPCFNGGTCSNTQNGFSCICPPNYTGHNCQFYDICLTKPCQNGGDCVIKSSSYFECNCTKDFFGPTCEKLNPCFNVSCSNRGACRYTTDDYFCLCESNFLGKNCEQCKPGFSGPDCSSCIIGFTGKHCDVPINYCTPNPCMNGFCLKDGFNYKCVCSEGWRGRNCSEKNCLLNPCQNGGVCTLGYNNQTDQIDYRCSCPSGLYGEQCEYTDPCDSSPCGIDEDCVISTTDISRNYLCVKAVNFCERMRPCNNNSECIYYKKNNTFYCRCLNGASNCDDPDPNSGVLTTNLKVEPTGLDKSNVKKVPHLGEYVIEKKQDKFSSLEHINSNFNVDLNNANVESSGSMQESEEYQSSIKYTTRMSEQSKSSSSQSDGLTLPSSSSNKEIFRIAKAESKLNAELPKFGFNFENLYILLPVGLVGFIIIAFLTVVIYVGVKSRSRTAMFSTKEPTTIRNIHYISDANTFIDNIKPLPNVSGSSIGYMGSERDYAENYGRV